MMRSLAYLNLFDRELTLGRQFLLERYALEFLRRMGLIQPRFLISLPVEIWSIILCPHTYCNADTHPGLHLQFDLILPPDYGDWLRCRLILGPYPHLRIPAKSGLAINENTKIVRMSEDGSRDLFGQVTVLRILRFSRSPSALNEIYPDNLIGFRNVRFLCIRGWDSRANLWPSLVQGFPELVSLTIHGKVYCSGKIALKQLETLGIHPDFYPSGGDTHFDFPKLKHLSIHDSSLPDPLLQLLNDHGPFLHSFLIHSYHSGYAMLPTFWDHYTSLRTVGIWPQWEQTIVPPPPGHPLQHLTIFISRKVQLRVKLIKETLTNFPFICDLSIEIYDLRRREKDALYELAGRFNVSLHFLPQLRQLPQQSQPHFSVLRDIFEVTGLPRWLELVAEIPFFILVIGIYPVMILGSDIARMQEYRLGTMIYLVAFGCLYGMVWCLFGLGWTWGHALPYVKALERIYLAKRKAPLQGMDKKTYQESGHT
ncbi:hypothetical protein CPB86DRAFT_822456 [Serendipita vermifera]|nr:hypothetical protein CPB86DRAFT_822456 [Serendipita vermifera]